MRKKIKHYSQKLRPAKIDRHIETDSQMLRRIARKFALLISIILLFDLLIDFFSILLDVVLNLMHLIIEFLEYSLEVVIEHLLHFDHHQSEMVIVNGVLLLILYGIYRLLIRLPKIAVTIKRGLLAFWLRHKRRELRYWQQLPLARKLKISAAYLLGSYCVIFLLTL